ncbi:tRNA(fMet)-specific endonuclease VapC [Methanobrevibacter cuticularis]|uniref:tRNA(FMet)-specific endonuclease VapC n=1 Tax=Methanobrevibacter cuticularis TaxID=47311 RepID=A0A166E5Q7_9EURY|nr:type II toxin-antitoxin system VapC family toxin [Methanobrevibacter cuticularis]KZX16308.1 tRNA(fMet)-specific endonuclease VapC [Methanobrevibacter cuticularis]
MIFYDTNFLVSYYIETENHHERALEIDKDIKNKKKIISTLAIAETINLLTNKLKLDKEMIKAVYNELNENYTILEDHKFYNETVENITSNEKRMPFFDYSYVTLMQELGIEEIATFDKHFDNIAGIVRIY